METEQTNPEIQHFITNESFIRWVKNPDQKTNDYWTAFLEKNPHQQQAVEEARKVVGNIRFQMFEPTSQQVTQMYEDIQGRLRQTRTIGYPAAGQATVWRTWLVAAGVVGVLLLSGWWFWLTHQVSGNEFATDFGEIRKVKLDDGTLVTLNGNTRLVVSNDLAHSPKREVQVNGEAVFEVAKRHGSTFTVKTKTGLTIEVLGTVFNVNTRQEKASVLLTEGKVKLSTATEQTEMKPGDLAVYNPQAKSLKVSEVSVNSLAWTKGEIILDNLTLPEIVAYLKDTYGTTVIIKDKALLDKQLVGKMPISNVEAFIENLAVSLDADIRKQAKNEYELQTAE